MRQVTEKQSPDIIAFRIWVPAVTNVIHVFEETSTFLRHNAYYSLNIQNPETVSVGIHTFI